jgi:hypothetical protein
LPDRNKVFQWLGQWQRTLPTHKTVEPFELYTSIKNKAAIVVKKTGYNSFLLVYIHINLFTNILLLTKFILLFYVNLFGKNKFFTGTMRYLG